MKSKDFLAASEVKVTVLQFLMILSLWKCSWFQNPAAGTVRRVQPPNRSRAGDSPLQGEAYHQSTVNACDQSWGPPVNSVIAYKSSFTGTCSWVFSCKQHCKTHVAFPVKLMKMSHMKYLQTFHNCRWNQLYLGPIPTDHDSGELKMLGKIFKKEHDKFCLLWVDGM